MITMPAILFGLGLILAIFLIIRTKNTTQKQPRPPLNMDHMIGFSEYTALDLPSWKFMDQMQERGFNLTRVFLLDVWETPGHPTESKQFLPWKKVNGKFDLEQWNEEYWVKLKDFVEYARQRAVMVILSLFDDCGLRYHGTFAMHPFNSDCNVQHWIGSDRFDSYDMGNAMARHVQEKFLDKVIETVGEYDNIIYEFCNEPSHANMQWAEWVKSIIEGKHGKAGYTMYAEHGVSAYLTHHNINHPSRVPDVRRNWIYSGDGCKRDDSLAHYPTLLQYAREKKMHHEHYFPGIILGDGSLCPELLNKL